MSAEVIDILMIDDDKANFDSYKNAAARQRIILRYTSNLKEGIIQLKNDKKIAAVILDGKGFINPDQQRGSEKVNFVHEALTALALLENEENRLIPKCVLTAWYDQLAESLADRVKVYDKKVLGNDEYALTEMFTLLKDQVFKTELYKIRKDFQDVFDAINADPILQSEDSKIYSLLQKSRTNTVEKADFVSAREILESILLKLNKSHKSMIPDNLLHPDGRPNLSYCVRYLKGLKINDGTGSLLYAEVENGKKRIPDHIAYALEYVKDTTSFLSHKTDHKWTKYAFHSVVSALCEIILWSVEYM
jgi:hypothetical protein